MNTRAVTLLAATAATIILATAGSAAGATLTGFSGVMTTEYGSTNPDSPSADTIKNWLLAGSVAGPLSDLPNLNFQADGAFNSTDFGSSSDTNWVLGGSLFHAGDTTRVGVDFHYTDFSGAHFENYGLFGQLDSGNLSFLGKGGWTSDSSGSSTDNGTYFGGGLAIYPTPNFAITPSAIRKTQDLSPSVSSHSTALEIVAEYMFSEDYGISGVASYSQEKTSIGSSDFDDNAFRIGLRWYTGGGSLTDRHRNGALNPWLPGAGSAVGR